MATRYLAKKEAPSQTQSVQKLLDELAKKEADATQKHLAVTAQLNETQRRVQDRMEELARARRARTHEERERKAENDRRIRDAEMKSRDRVEEVDQARKRAARACEDAEKRAEAAQSSMKAAQRSLQDLRTLAQKRIASAEKGTALAAEEYQAHVNMTDEEETKRIQDFETTAAALHTEAQKNREDLERAAMDSLERAADRAGSRARFRELVSLSVVRDHMPQREVMAAELMQSVVNEFSQHPGKYWPWDRPLKGHELRTSSPPIYSQPHLDGKIGSDLFANSMRYHPVCLAMPWFGSDDPKAQSGPSRQMLSEEYIQTPPRPKSTPVGERVGKTLPSKWQGFIKPFGADNFDGPQRGLFKTL